MHDEHCDESSNGQMFHKHPGPTFQFLFYITSHILACVLKVFAFKYRMHISNKKYKYSNDRHLFMLDSSTTNAHFVQMHIFVHIFCLLRAILFHQFIQN